jgi:hypothetical protein
MDDGAKTRKSDMVASGTTEFSIYKPEDGRRLSARFVPAQVAELADAVDSKSSGEILVGSIPTLGTNEIIPCEMQFGD